MLSLTTLHSRSVPLRSRSYAQLTLLLKGYDLTDRDSVRLLLATRKQAELNKSGDLNSQLSEALTDFGK